MLRSCISKINNTFIDNTEDLKIIMPVYNLLGCSGNYFMTWGSLWNYYRDQVNDDANENNADSYMINNSKATTSKSFECNTKIIRSTSADNDTLDADVGV